MYTGQAGVHRAGWCTQDRLVYTGQVDVHRTGGCTQDRWIYTGQVDVHRQVGVHRSPRRGVQGKGKPVSTQEGVVGDNGTCYEKGK